jgi:hypothetical protein
MAGGKGLTWSEISKRYKQCFEVIYDRIKNNKPFILLSKDRLSEDNGVEVYFKMVGISIPEKVNGRWKQSKEYIEFEPKRFSSFKNFYSGKNGILEKIQESIKSDPSGIGNAPFRVNFYTSTRKSIATSVNSGKILKDNGLGMDVGFGGKVSRGQTRTINWGKLKYYVDMVDSSYTLNYPTATEQGEADFINTFNKALDDLGIPMIDLQIGTKTFENVVGVNKVSGTPKADLAFVALQNRKLVEVAWCSHKQGSTASHFQQWGGVTHFPRGKFTELDEFVDYMKSVIGQDKLFDLTKMGPTTFGMDVTDMNLEMQSVYGKMYGHSEGPSNCTAVLQGEPSLRKVGNKYALHMSAHIMMNGTRMTGQYEPVLMLIKKASSENIADESIKGVRSDYGIRGARVVVSSKGGRTITHKVFKNRQGQFITQKL